MSGPPRLVSLAQILPSGDYRPTATVRAGSPARTFRGEPPRQALALGQLQRGQNVVFVPEASDRHGWLRPATDGEPHHGVCFADATQGQPLVEHPPRQWRTAT